MATNPDIQDRVYAELKNSNKKKISDFVDFSNLPYTKASVAEAQRIRSVVPFGIPHGTVDEMRIGDYVIPKGTMIVPLQWAVHMNPKVYEDPETFNPQRFLDEDGNFLAPLDFIPFQTGKYYFVSFQMSFSFPTERLYQVCKYEMRILDDRWCTGAVWHCCVINKCQTRTSDKLGKCVHSVVLLCSICRNLYWTHGIREQR